MAMTLGEAVVKIRGDSSQLSGDLDKARGIVGAALGGAAGSAAGPMGTAIGTIIGNVISQAMFTITSLIGGTGGSIGQAMMGAAQASIDVNANMEKLETSMSILAGSAERAKKLIADLAMFANQTPFEMPGLTKAANSLLIAGFKTEEIIPVLRRIGDAAAASPLGMEESVQRIVKAISDVKATSKLLGPEIRQLAEVGVPIRQMLAEHMGISIADVMKQVEGGNVSFDTFFDALMGGFEKRFDGMMEKQSKTWLGMLSTMHDSLNLLILKPLGEPLFNKAKQSIKELIDILSSSQIVGIIKNLADGMKSAFGAFDSNDGRFREWSRKLLDVVDGLSRGFKDVMALVDQIPDIGKMLGIDTVIDSLSLLSQNWGMTWEFMKLLAEKTVLTMIDTFTTTLPNQIIASFQGISATLPTIFQAMVAQIQAILQALMEQLVRFGETMGEIFTAIKEGRFGDVQGIAEKGLSGMIDNAVAAAKAQGERDAKALMDAAKIFQEAHKKALEGMPLGKNAEQIAALDKRIFDVVGKMMLERDIKRMEQDWADWLKGMVDEEEKQNKKKKQSMPAADKAQFMAIQEVWKQIMLSINNQEDKHLKELQDANEKHDEANKHLGAIAGAIAAGWPPARLA